MSTVIRLGILFIVTCSSLFANEQSVSVDSSLAFGAIAVIFILTIILFFLIKQNRKQARSHQEAIDKVRFEALEAERAKDTFLANVSHETRTPMTAIIGLSHILLQSDLNNTQIKNVTKIKRSAEHLLAITNDILDFSKIEAGKLDISSNSFESSDFFGSLADIVGIQALEKRLDLVFDISYQVPTTLIGDSLRISQVLINLLNNAIKFTEKGEVLLRASVASRRGDTYQILFEVKDTGIGLTEEQIAKLFQAFDQADNKISRKYGGTGLGLAISKELVEKMDGKLDIKSTFRSGSTFYFTIPLKVSANAVDTHNAHNKRINRMLSDKTVLILESNTYTSQLLFNTLSHFGALPKIVQSIDGLYLQLQEKHYDAIFIDEHNASKLRAVALLHTKSNAIVLLKYEVVTNIINSKINFNASITKPFTYQSILQALSEIFDESISLHSVKQAETTFDDILTLKGSKVLLVEDNEGNQMVVEGLLEGSGIELTTVTNGQKAVEIVFDDANAFELVLMDINMPVMDGYAATSIIREYQKYDNMPIIAMTANITESDIGKSKSIGMQDHLSKPIDVSTFYRTLLQFITPKISEEESKIAIDAKKENSEPTELSSLPYIDIEDGLSRLNNNSNAYQNVLHKFADMFNDITHEFRELANTDSYEEGRALAHNLKGLSGNIGAKEIYSLSQELEECFKDGDGEFNALINAIDAKLEPLLEAIRSLKEEETAEPDITKTLITPKIMQTLLSKLYVNAKKRKAHEIKKVCKEIELYQWPEEHHKAIDDILTQVKNYQFGKVNIIVESINPKIKDLI